MEFIQAIKKSICGTPVYFVKSSEGARKAWLTRKLGGSHKAEDKPKPKERESWTPEQKEAYRQKAEQTEKRLKAKKAKVKPEPFKMKMVIPFQETERRIREHLQETKRSSSTTRYIGKNPHGVDIWTKADLIANVPISEKGTQFYAQTNVQNIRRVIEFKNPDEVAGLHDMVVLEKGDPAYHYINQRTEKNARKKFVRSKNVGKHIKEIRAFYKKGMESSGYDKQIGTILAMIDQYTMRVGSKADVDEGMRKVEDLKNRTLIKSPDDGESYFVFIKPDGEKLIGPSVRMDEIDDEIKEARQAKNKDEVEKLKQEKKDIVKPMPKAWKEVYKLGHFGATQLEARHVRMEGKEVWLDFIGKSGVRWNFPVKDASIAKTLLDVQKGKSDRDQLFPDVKYPNVIELLKEKWKCLAKDFRSYHATKTFADIASEYPAPKTERDLKSIEGQIFERVSQLLWNTKGMAKKSYVDPAVYSAWRDGLLQEIQGSPVKKSFSYVVRI